MKRIKGTTNSGDDFDFEVESINLAVEKLRGENIPDKEFYRLDVLEENDECDWDYIGCLEEVCWDEKISLQI